MVDPIAPEMSRIHDANPFTQILVFVKLASEWTRLQKAVRFGGQFSESRFFPTLRHSTDFGLFLGFAAEAFGE